MKRIAKRESLFGFTLVEALVAMAALPIISLAVYLTFTHAQGAFMKVDKETSQADKLFMWHEILTQDLERIIDSRQFLFSGSSEKMEFVIVDHFLWEGGIPSNTLAGPFSKVTYEARRETGKIVMTRRSEDLFAGAGHSGALNQLELTECYLFYGEINEKGEWQWFGEWKDKESLPRAVRMVMRPTYLSPDEEPITQTILIDQRGLVG